jgi:hypothetical protein
MIPTVKRCALFASALLMIAFPLRASTPVANVEFTVTSAGPRQLESTLQRSIPADYAKAWQTLSEALQSADPSVLDRYWTGVAHDKLQRLVKDQMSTDVQVRYIDKSHRLQAVFYPTDGAALLLHDTAQLEIQVLSAGKLIHTEDITEKYVVLMTPGQDRWLVRIFQTASGF